MNDLLWEKAIVDALQRRAPGRTICPSEVARACAGPQWREAMPAVRAAAFAMAGRGALRITQRGIAVMDFSTMRGPIRLGLPET